MNEQFPLMNEDAELHRTFNKEIEDEISDIGSPSEYRKEITVHQMISYILKDLCLTKNGDSLPNVNECRHEASPLYSQSSVKM